MKRKALARLTGVLLAAAGLPGMASAQGIVVSAKGPIAARLPMGTPLKAEQRILLGNGDVLVVALAGSTRRLEGPGSFLLDRPSPAAVEKLSLAFGQGDRPVVAGLRRMQSPKAVSVDAPNLWYVNASTGGHFCVVEGRPVVLWRSDISADAAIVGETTQPGKLLPWPAGQSLLELPLDYGAGTGAAFAVRDAAGRTSRIELTPMGATASDLAALVTELGTAGCARQVEFIRNNVLPSR